MKEQLEFKQQVWLNEQLQEKMIFLVRHGETQWNSKNRLQGSQDSPLTSNGMKQANEAKDNLQQFVIDHAFVSPLKRAKDTMAIIMKGKDIDVCIKDDLREINLGPWEGKSREQIAHSYPDEYMAFCETPDLFNLTGADTFQDLQDRVINEIESIFANEKNRNCLVVSHLMTIKVAVAHYSSIPLSHLSRIPDLANGGFFCLLKRGGNVYVEQL